MEKTKVKCDIENCRHNQNNICSLKVLDIISSTKDKKCQNKQETICNNFIS